MTDNALEFCQFRIFARFLSSEMCTFVKKIKGPYFKLLPSPPLPPPSCTIPEWNRKFRCYDDVTSHFGTLWYWIPSTGKTGIRTSLIWVLPTLRVNGRYSTEKKHNFRKYNRTKIDSLGVPYDYLSVMHYSATAFGSGKVTIKAKDDSVLQLGQRVGLYPSDVKQADLLYKCEGKKTLKQWLRTSDRCLNGSTYLPFFVLLFCRFILVSMLTSVLPFLPMFLPSFFHSSLPPSFFPPFTGPFSLPSLALFTVPFHRSYTHWDPLIFLRSYIHCCSFLLPFFLPWLFWRSSLP